MRRTENERKHARTYACAPLLKRTRFPLNKDEPLGVFVIIMVVYLGGFLAVVYGNGWRLSAGLGYVFFAGHLVFVVFAIVVTFVDIGF